MPSHVISQGGSVAPSLRRALQAVLRSANSSTTDGTAFTVASGQGTEGVPQFLAVYANAAVTAEAPNSVTGRGLTWVKVDEQFLGAASTIRKVSLFRACGRPTPATLAVNFAGTMQSVIWVDFEVMGGDPSGVDAANAIVQVFKEGANAATTLHAAFAAAMENARNGSLCSSAISIQGTITPDPDFTTVGQDNEAAGTGTLEVEFAVGQAVCDPTFASAVYGEIYAEIRAGVA